MARHSKNYVNISVAGRSFGTFFPTSFNFEILVSCMIRLQKVNPIFMFALFKRWTKSSLPPHSLVSRRKVKKILTATLKHFNQESGVFGLSGSCQSGLSQETSSTLHTYKSKYSTLICALGTTYPAAVEARFPEAESVRLQNSGSTTTLI